MGHCRLELEIVPLCNLLLSEEASLLVTRRDWKAWSTAAFPVLLSQANIVEPGTVAST